MKNRTLNGLKRLRKSLDKELPNKTRSSTLVMGTWNIRNFDDDRFNNGHRTTEDFFYIAEIISRFDIIAVQELCDDNKPLDTVMRILGNDYDYIVTDVTEGRAGNGERLGFIFDKAKVSFRGVAGELVLPDNLQVIDGERKRQFSRSPFMCSFQSGWFKFALSTVHIYFGKDRGKPYKRRVAEIESVAKFLAKRAKADIKGRYAENHVLVGDFNIVEPGSDGYNALEKQGFEIFQNREGSNRDQTKFYDQISFRVNPGELCLSDGENNKGIFNFFKAIYRPRDFDAYKKPLLKAAKSKIDRQTRKLAALEKKLVKASSVDKADKLKTDIEKAKAKLADWKDHLKDDVKLKKYYESEWRTFHGSDHYPLWVELKIDFSEDYLNGIQRIS